jgi:hypothetical protein
VIHRLIASHETDTAIENCSQFLAKCKPQHERFFSNGGHAKETPIDRVVVIDGRRYGLFFLSRQNPSMTPSSLMGRLVAFSSVNCCYFLIEIALQLRQK